MRREKKTFSFWGAVAAYGMQHAASFFHLGVSGVRESPWLPVNAAKSAGTRPLVSGLGSTEGIGCVHETYKVLLNAGGFAVVVLLPQQSQLLVPVLPFPACRFPLYWNACTP